MSVSIDDLCNVLYDSNGPSKIGIELEILDNDGNISPTAYTDLHEFLLSLLIKGIFRFNIIPNETNINEIANKLQIHFNKINIKINFELCNSNDFVEPCKIYFDIVDFNLHIIKLIKSEQPEVLKDVAGIYILKSQLNGSDTHTHSDELTNDKKRKFTSLNDLILKINFSFIF